ncbi:hypothetical protein AB0D71_38385 [Streptomyces avermitilis]
MTAVGLSWSVVWSGLAVDHGTRPNQVIYSVDDRDPVEWTVPKA